MSERISETFEDRLQEIEAYLDLLEALEIQVRLGPPSIGGRIITVQQQKILYSGVYLQLYNLVEATVNWCVDAACAAAASAVWKPSDLSETFLREWVRTVARTHVPLNDENRLDSALEMCRVFIGESAISSFVIDRRGNWDDKEIESVTQRLGCELRINKATLAAVKKPIRDEKGALSLIRDLRNRLGHGSLSFSECGEGATVVDLRDLKERTANYLREVVQGFHAFIDDYHFLTPEKRP